MRETPPLCAQATARPAAPALAALGADAADEELDDEELDDEELFDDGELLRGNGGRPASRRPK